MSNRRLLLGTSGNFYPDYDELVPKNGYKVYNEVTFKWYSWNQTPASMYFLSYDEYNNYKNIKECWFDGDVVYSASGITGTINNIVELGSSGKHTQGIVLTNITSNGSLVNCTCNFKEDSNIKSNQKIYTFTGFYDFKCINNGSTIIKFKPYKDASYIEHQFSADTFTQFRFIINQPHVLNLRQTITMPSVIIDTDSGIEVIRPCAMTLSGKHMYNFFNTKTGEYMLDRYYGNGNIAGGLKMDNDNLTVYVNYSGD